MRNVFPFYFVDSKEIEGLGNGLKQPFTSYSLGCGESPWEGKLEGDDDVPVDGKNEKQETSDTFKMHKMVSQHLFLYIVLLTYSFFKNKVIRAEVQIIFTPLTKQMPMNLNQCALCKMLIFINPETWQYLLGVL